MKKIATGFILCLLTMACSPSLYKPIIANENKNVPASLKELQEGRKIYVLHCSGCHNLHLPNEYSTIAWERNLDEMQTKANITNSEKELILKYLLNN